MSSSSIKTDSSLLSRIDVGVHKIESALNLIAGITVLALIFLAVVQIFGRKLFNTPLPGFIDWVEQFMAIFALLGISYCHRLGGHIRMDIFIGQLRGRILWFAEIISTLLMMVVIAALIYGSYFHFQRSTNGTFLGNMEILFTQGISAFFKASSNDSSIDIALPLWPAKVLVPIAFTLLFIRLALHLWGYSRAFIKNETAPVAVPLIEDVATQAMHEAETVDNNNNNGAA